MNQLDTLAWLCPELCQSDGKGRLMADHNAQTGYGRKEFCYVSQLNGFGFDMVQQHETGVQKVILLRCS